MKSQKPNTVAIAANAAWNVVNFRQQLIRAIEAEGYRIVVIAPMETTARSRAERLGVEWIVVRLNRAGINPFDDLRLLWTYWKILKRLSPRVFLGFTIKPNIYGSIAARWVGVPAIANVSGLGTVFVNGGLLMRFVIALYRFSLAKGRLVFFQNCDDLNAFIENGIVHPEKARLLPGSGINLEYFTPVPLPHGAPTFLLIARLLREKGIPEYIEAARLIRTNFPDVRFQLLGPLDPENPSAVGADELARWISGGDVDYVGFTDDVRPIIAAATVIVLPTRYREGVPRSLLEGAAMARPLIATKMPGCRDLVEDGVNGLLVEPGNAEALRIAMETLVRMNPEQRTRMGQAARATVERRFDEKHVIDAYVEVIRTVAKRR